VTHGRACAPARVHRSDGVRSMAWTIQRRLRARGPWALAALACAFALAACSNDATGGSRSGDTPTAPTTVTLPSPPSMSPRPDGPEEARVLSQYREFFLSLADASRFDEEAQIAWLRRYLINPALARRGRRNPGGAESKRQGALRKAGATPRTGRRPGFGRHDPRLSRQQPGRDCGCEDRPPGHGGRAANTCRDDAEAGGCDLEDLDHRLPGTEVLTATMRAVIAGAAAIAAVVWPVHVMAESHDPPIVVDTG
jgi:hypothetical protein